MLIKEKNHKHEQKTYKKLKKVAFLNMDKDRFSKICKEILRINKNIFNKKMKDLNSLLIWAIVI